MASIADRFKENQESTQNTYTGPKLKVGIIRTGWISEAHIESYLRCPDVEIVAAADLIPGKAEALFEKLGVSGVRFYPHHKEMLGYRNFGCGKRLYL